MTADDNHNFTLCLLVPRVPIAFTRMSWYTPDKILDSRESVIVRLIYKETAVTVMRTSSEAVLNF